MKRAIVLSGGGSKGAYQMGVWKALLKLNIKYDIVTGTSVGALNAALMTQKTYYRGLNLWKNLNYKMIFKDYDSFSDESKVIKNYVEGAVNGGLDVTSLEETIVKLVNIKKIYKSKIDMGIVTVNVKNLKPNFLKKNSIEPNKLSEYLLASASCFPAFKMKKIDDQNYIDGGLVDNLPINLAVELGANEVIAVDLNEVGIKKIVKDKNIKITYIKPRNNIGKFLVFKKEISLRAIKFGYNDTMKTYHKLDGNKFTFKKNDLSKNFDKYKKQYMKFIDVILNEDSSNIIKKTASPILKRSFMNKNDFMLNKDFNRILEKLGMTFELEETNIYKIKKYNKLLIKSFKDFNIEENVDNIKDYSLIKKLLNNKALIKYIYMNLEIKSKKTYKLMLLFPEEFLCAIYLRLISNKNF